MAPFVLYPGERSQTTADLKSHPTSSDQEHARECLARYGSEGRGEWDWYEFQNFRYLLFRTHTLGAPMRTYLFKFLCTFIFILQSFPLFSFSGFLVFLGCSAIWCKRSGSFCVPNSLHLFSLFFFCLVGWSFLSVPRCLLRPQFSFPSLESFIEDCLFHLFSFFFSPSLVSVERTDW